MRHRNPFAHRRTVSARQRRRADAPSPRQASRIVQELRETASREIKRGLADRIAGHGEEPATASP